jgi:integrase/recombinase XerC
MLGTRRLQQLAPGEETLAEIFKKCRARAETNHTTKTTYELHKNLKRVLAWLEGRGVYSAKKVTRALIEDYKTARRFATVRGEKKKLGAAAVNRDLASWKKAMKVAVELRCCRKEILDEFVPLREPRPEPNQRGLTRAEIDAFLKAETSEAHRALWRTALGTALRDDELRHMEPSDIRKAEIVVTPKEGWTTKGYRYRTVPVSPATVKAALQFMELRATISLEPKTLWRQIQRTRIAAKIDWRFSMHDFRRAWASHMLKKGFRVEQISRWLGHADVMTTMRYLRLVDPEMPKAKDLPW